MKQILLILITFASFMVQAQTDPVDHDGRSFRRTEYTASNGTDIVILWGNTCELNHPNFYTLQNSVEFTWVGPAGTAVRLRRTNQFWLDSASGHNPSFSSTGLLVNERGGFDNNFIDCAD